MSTTVVNVRSGQPYDVYVGRSNARYGLKRSKWANPFRLATQGELGAFLEGRDEIIAHYRAYLLACPDLLAALPELRGRVLACWCAPLSCHADVLAEFADGGAS